MPSCSYTYKRHSMNRYTDAQQTLEIILIWQGRHPNTAMNA